jgi:pSer/pThr/pTyr-binding forkhead associated (FHA) protein
MPAASLESAPDPTSAPKSNVMQETPSAAAIMTPAPLTIPGSQFGRTTIRVVLKPSLEVVRGERLGVTFPILEGKNVIGRTVNQPADIDLTGLERVEQVWTSRQHAIIHFDGRAMILEDLKSLNGTFINRTRLHPGQQKVIQPNDVIQIGTVQLRVHVLAEKLEQKQPQG